MKALGLAPLRSTAPFSGARRFSAAALHALLQKWENAPMRVPQFRQ